MISRAMYNEKEISQEDICKMYIEANNHPLHIYRQRLKEWTKKQIECGSIILEITEESLDDYLSKHKKEIRKRAERIAIANYSSRHKGKKNKALRDEYPSTDQFQKDVEESMESVIHEYTLNYEVFKSIPHDEAVEWIDKDDKFLMAYNKEHEVEYLPSISEMLKDLAEYEGTVRRDIEEKLTDVLSKKQLFCSILDDDYDPWADDEEEDEDYDGLYTFDTPSRYTTVEVTPMYINDFLWHFMDNDLPDIFFDAKNKLSDIFFKLTGITEEDLSDKKDNTAVKIEKILNKVKDNVINESGFDDIRVLKRFVEQNPYYQKAVDKLGEAEQEKLRLKENILSTMPKTYPDLFPLARKMKRHFILHIGPTNSGKTYAAMERLKEKGSGIYLAPLRLLAFEQYEALNSSGYPCSLITGEEREIKPGASIQSSTVEIFDAAKEYDCVVLDEAQMINDKARGWAWTAVALGICCPEIHICMAPQARNIIVNLIKECGDTYEEIQHNRKVPLIVDTAPVQSLKAVQPGDALIVFSKRNVHAVARELNDKGIKASIVYGNLPYDVRQNEARKFQNGETSVLVSTDAIGMGLNLPIKRIVFLESSKYDGSRSRLLTEEEFKQIGGRAGRMGIFDEGHCAIWGSPKLLKENMEKKTPAIENAVIGFPEQLIGLKGKLSDIIRQWDDLPVSLMYKHADLSVMLSLSIELERYTQDKRLVYEFVTIPFNEKTDAKMLWLDYFRAELNKRYLSFSEVCKRYHIDVDGSSLANLEYFHKLCDLAYAYCSRFGHEEDINLILETKKAISRKIIQLLSEKKLEARKCKYCGKKLAWNYPYGMCNGCYTSRFSRKSYYDWEEDFDELY